MTGRHAAPEPGPGDPVKGRHAVTPATALGTDILAWEADAAAHAQISAEYRASEHSTAEIIEHVTGQLTQAGHLLSRARMLFLMAAPDIPRAQR